MFFCYPEEKYDDRYELTTTSELYSDLTHDKDYYDGLLDVSHASEWVTVSNTYLHDHWKVRITSSPISGSLSRFTH